VENEQKPVQTISLVPLEAKKPPSGQWVFVVLLLFLAAGLISAVWMAYQVAQQRNSHESETGWHEFEEPSHSAEKTDSQRQMREISEALFRYRDQMGGGLRLPERLDELTEVELLPRDYSFRGPLSGKPIVYRPEIPPSQDPALWVLAHDRLYGRRPNPRGYGQTQGLIGAMVLFGDGSVRFLDEREVSQFGGLNEPVAAR
jgi:hypothetical protein